MIQILLKIPFTGSCYQKVHFLILNEIFQSQFHLMRENEVDVLQITDLPFHYEDRQAEEELLEHLNTLLKDSDAVAEKEIIKTFLRKTSDVFQFTVVGASSAGKTTLLQKLFGKELIFCRFLRSKEFLLWICQAWSG